MDARIDDRGAGDGQRPGDARKQPGMVGGIDHHFRHRARGQGVGVHRQRRVAAFGVADHAGVAFDAFGVEAEPVAGITQREEVFPLCGGEIRQQAGDHVLDAGDARIAFGGGEPAFQHLGDAGVELAQQRGFPAVPDFGRNGADVRDGEDEQQAQAFGRLDGVGEVQNRFRVVDVARKRGLAEEQMVQDEPGDHFGFLGGQAQGGPDMQRDFGAQFGMVAAAAFRDVVQQKRHVERAARLHLVDQRARHRGDFDQLAGLDGVEDLDRLDGVNVDGKNMVGVELHLADDAAPVRQIAAEHAGFVEQRQPAGGIAGALAAIILAAA